MNGASLLLALRFMDISLCLELYVCDTGILGYESRYDELWLQLKRLRGLKC